MRMIRQENKLIAHLDCIKRTKYLGKKHKQESQKPIL